MNADISKIRERLSDTFTDLVQINNSIIRCVKKKNEIPYAIYYFDCFGNLPETQDELNKYQDENIGKYYFKDTPLSLQWNNYLYFVVNQETVDLSLKQIIEQDQNYARKKIVLDKDLESILKPLLLSSLSADQKNNVLSIWAEKLEEVGIFDIIQDEKIH
ncbi:MAG: hypothetical protein H7832_15025 [Magnetococcus sp. DMHC-6]